MPDGGLRVWWQAAAPLYGAARRRSEFASTLTDESAIAPAATIGCSRPAAASGMATAL